MGANQNVTGTEKSYQTLPNATNGNVILKMTPI